MTLSGEELFERRQAAGLSQGELADRSGISRQDISAYEQGHKTLGEDRSARLMAALSDRHEQHENGQGERTFRQDAPPRAKKAAPKQRPAPKVAAIPLAAQLELPYKIIGDIAGYRGLPQTRGILYQQAPLCAQAWDTFLMRYPALREKIEQGMIAGDIVGLIMAHVPIVQVARMEIAERQAAMEGYTGGLPADGSAAA